MQSLPLYAREVHELIKDGGEREKFFNALRQYQNGHDLSRLLEDVQQVFDEPSKLELFEHMRPLILLHHQIEYSQRMPSVLGVKPRIVRLRRRAGEELGFAVRGGLEHGVGVFVTDVLPGSQAAKQGLMIGDEIITVNGFTISEAIHNDVLNLIKARDDIVLKVKQIGMLPVKDDPKTAVTWKYTENGLHNNSIDDVQKPKDLKIFVDSTGHHSLGCGILSGPVHLPGIFIESITPGSVASEVNLEPGDQIVEVNGTTFHRITHNEAVHALVSSRQLNLTIRKGVGMELMKQIPAMRPTIKTESNTREMPVNSSSNRGPEWNRGSTNSANGSAQNMQSSTPGSKVIESRSSSQMTNGQTVDNWMPHFPESVGRPRQRSPESPLTPEMRNVAAYSDQSNRSSSSSSASSVDEVRGQMRNTNENEADRNSRSELREEIRNRLSSSNLSPLSGSAAVMQQRKLQNTQKPDLLGFGEPFQYNETVSNKMYHMFSASELDGRGLHSLTYDKKMDLGVSMEGGLGSPLNGKILVAIVFDDGVAKKSGKMRVGDQLMAVNGVKLVDITVTKAETIIQDVASSQDTVELVFCASTLVNEEESMTYF